MNTPLYAKLPELKFAYHALEPFIDAKTMEIHHQKHHQAYIDNFLKNSANIDTSQDLKHTLREISKYTDVVRNNLGGHYNHTFFWSILAPKFKIDIPKVLESALIRDFESVENFFIQFKNLSIARFGSGWCWLYLSNTGKLKICSTPNQDNLLMDISVTDSIGEPLIGIDLWEHAYYLKYQNKRSDYIDAIWNVINWDSVSDNYEYMSKLLTNIK